MSLSANSKIYKEITFSVIPLSCLSYMNKNFTDIAIIKSLTFLKMYKNILKCFNFFCISVPKVTVYNIP